MGLAKDFKTFAMRGNVVDMAVGIIIGGAFGTIVKSLVSDVLMPPIGLLLGNVDFSELFLVLKSGTPAGPYATLQAAQEAGAVTINYGLFFNALVSFVIVAFAVFMLVRGMNRLQQKPEPAPAAPTTKVPTPSPPLTQVHSAPSPEPAPPVPVTRPGKVVIDPLESLPRLLLRWGGAPVAALLALLVVVFVFRKKFRAGERGIPATVPLAAAPGRAVNFSDPSKTWETLISAIEDRDFDIYRLCWQQSYPDGDLDLSFQKSLMNWKYYDYTVVQTEPHPKSKERFYLHVKRSTKFDRKDLEERVKRVSLVLTDGGWKFEEVPFGF